EVAALVEQNNQVQQLLTGVGFYLWTDGKFGGYVRYVADGQRFGWRDELVLDERWVRLGRGVHVCPQGGEETKTKHRAAHASSNDAADGPPASDAANAQPAEARAQFLD